MREAPPAITPLIKSIARSGPKYSHMAPASFLTGAPPAALGRAENEKAPSVTGGARKIPARDIQRTRNSLNHPLEVDSMMRAHMTVVCLKSRMMVVLNAASLSQILRRTG